MRIAAFGDIVGKAGRKAFAEFVPGLRDRLALDFVLVNGENAAGGFGVTEKVTEALLEAGADVVTLGNHAWDQAEALTYIERQDRLLRPVNYPELARAPGRGAQLYDAPGGRRVLVMNVLGRVHMDALNDPFDAVERQLSACPLGEACDAVVVDFHGETTSEKQAMGLFCDGRASLVVGTHTHVPTADWRILPDGTAYITDLGMCGDYDSVLGMDKAEPLNRFTSRIRAARFEPAEGPGAVSGVFVETDDRTGLAVRCAPIRLGAVLEETCPDS